jgi:hypothetical protein
MRRGAACFESDYGVIDEDDYALMKWTPPSHQRHHNVPSVPDGLAGDKQEEESELN